MSADGVVDDKERLLFGAGFAFGVMFTMLVLAVVVATVTGELLGTDLVVTIGTGVFLAGVVGVALYVLAFPENRLQVPVGDALRAEAEAASGSGESESEGRTGEGSTGEDGPKH
jgi:hypothetical protein